MQEYNIMINGWQRFKIGVLKLHITETQHLTLLFSILTKKYSHIIQHQVIIKAYQ